MEQQIYESNLCGSRAGSCHCCEGNNSDGYIQLRNHREVSMSWFYLCVYKENTNFTDRLVCGYKSTSQKTAVKLQQSFLCKAK